MYIFFFLKLSAGDGQKSPYKYSTAATEDDGGVKSLLATATGDLHPVSFKLEYFMQAWCFVIC